ncbi:hypothetical protein [Longirhabdus pacifica]|uniref:hypothetical protein n=1 Tax=Longirhabdus pacifica TaxID=2305227 RepID=UPI0010090B2E|nr:hypothetical protein [Longirhabdus pacifica]
MKKKTKDIMIPNWHRWTLSFFFEELSHLLLTVFIFLFITLHFYQSVQLIKLIAYFTLFLFFYLIVAYLVFYYYKLRARKSMLQYFSVHSIFPIFLSLFILLKSPQLALKIARKNKVTKLHVKTSALKKILHGSTKERLKSAIHLMREDIEKLVKVPGVYFGVTYIGIGKSNINYIKEYGEFYELNGTLDFVTRFIIKGWYKKREQRKIFGKVLNKKSKWKTFIVIIY